MPGPAAPLHENPWFRVFLRDGFYTIEPTQEHVGILPLVGEDVLLVRVHRPVMGTDLLELPAGGADPGEPPLRAAMRELAEETGIAVADPDRFEPLSPLCVSPDRIPSWPSLFRVRLSEAEYAGRAGHDAEVQELLRLGPAQVRRALLTGDLRSSLSIAMIFRHLCEQGHAEGGAGA